MSTNTVSVPAGEVLRSMIDAAEAAAACGFRPRPFGFGRNAVPAPVREPAVLRRHPHLVRFADVEADLELLIDRAMPAILFIDEIDGIGKRQPAERDYADYWNTVVNKALELLDGAVKSEGVILVGATNRPQEIDDALKRSGRLETHIEIPMPDIATLAEIFVHHLGDDLASLVDGRASDETRAGEAGSEAAEMNADEAAASNIHADRDSDEHTLRDAREGAAT